MSSARPQASSQPSSLKQSEARERAALLDVATYDVTLDLDRGDETFGAVSEISLVSRGGPTFLEVQPLALTSVRVNGDPVDVALLDRGRVPIHTEPGENHVVVESLMRYRHDGEGMHRTVDPADGRHYTYAMTFLDAAPRIFGCFDQPDLKAVWRLRVRTPHDWVVLGNTPATQVEPGSWELGPTLPLPTYLVTLVAGPYHVLHSEHDGIKLGLSARASIGRYLEADAEELFTITAQSFGELHRLFGIRYPFGDYHQAFVPEFNAGAMENAGCVTFRDPLVFQSKVTRTERIFRATVVAHEMAHMWFGDLVTPRWWDDLWLNESFADYMGVRVTGDVTEYSDAVLSDAYLHRAEGLRADQRPSTHPVAGNGADDTAAALQNFDGISYAKGSSVLKQLNRRLGDGVFFAGVRDHFERHRFGNATMADLVSSWEAAGAGDLSGFTDGWLLTAGPDRLEVQRSAGLVRRTPPVEHPAEREHVAGLATQEGGRPGSWTVQRLVVSTSETAVQLGPGPVVPDPHLETWAVTLLDEETMGALTQLLPATEDALLRTSAWMSVFSAFLHNRLDPEVALDLVEAAIPSEDTDDGVNEVLGWALREVLPVAADAGSARRRIHRATAARTSTAEPGSGLQLSSFHAQVATSDQVDDLRDWLGSGDRLPDGVVVDLELRWRILRRLAALGATDRGELAAALEDDRTAVSQVEHVRSVASLPDEAAKAWAWQRFTGEVEVSNYEVEAAGLGLWQLGQEALTDAYVGRYFEDLPGTAGVRSGYLLGLATGFFYPRSAVREEAVARAQAVLADASLDSTIRRALVDQTWDLERRLAVRKAFQR